MPDRKTIIAALEYCAVGTKDCCGCPMNDACNGVSSVAMAAAAKLLKKIAPRCRECKHWQKDSEIPDGVDADYPATGYCGLFERTYLANDFCSYHTEADWGWADDD